MLSLSSLRAGFRSAEVPAFLRRLAYVAVGLAAAQTALAQGSNRLEDIRANVLAGNKVELTLRLSDTAPQPLTFTVDNPARIALDLPDTSVAMASRRIDVKQGALDTVNVAEANGRTRVVLNVDSLVPYETRVQGNSITVTLGAGRGGSINSPSAAAAAVASSSSSSAAVGGVRGRHRGRTGSADRRSRVQATLAGPDARRSPRASCGLGCRGRAVRIPATRASCAGDPRHQHRPGESADVRRDRASSRGCTE